jgi:chorismate dehydratase
VNDAAPPLRVAAVGYLNARPLIEGLDGRPGLVVSVAAPSEVADRLASGAVDVGLVPVAEAARLGFERVSDACVAAFGPVDSVLLFLRRAPGDVRRAALDRASRTSRELAAWRLRRAGAVFVAIDAAPEAAIDDPSVDATLAIGDAALALRRRGLPCLDLADEWTRATGLPFVFAAWAARPGVVARAPGLADELAAARDRGLARLGALAERAAAEGLGTRDELDVYLRKRLRYVLGPEERRGLDRFLEAAVLPPLR